MTLLTVKTASQLNLFHFGNFLILPDMLHQKIFFSVNRRGSLKDLFSRKMKLIVEWIPFVLWHKSREAEEFISSLKLSNHKQVLSKFPRLKLNFNAKSLYFCLWNGHFPLSFELWSHSKMFLSFSWLEIS